MITTIWRWLVDPAHWQGPFGVGTRLAEHTAYSLVIVLIAAVIALPLGVWIGHTGRLRGLVTAANAARAVPTLGLLFALALWLGPHLPGRSAFVVPSVVALVLLAIPPILAGAYAGVEAVDPAARDAARGMGMTSAQVVLRVEVPCAAALILSGVRAAMLQVVATATIAAYVGLGGLGRLLVDGLASADYPQTAAGALLVSALALAADAVLALAQRILTPAGLRATSSGRRGGFSGRASERTRRVEASASS